MVAFELARYFESKGNTADAGRWYLTAAERFRRADWKTKAQEGAMRLGATEPAELPAPPPLSARVEEPAAEPAPQTSSAEMADAAPASGELEVATAQPEPQVRPQAEPSRQRRGRRGGRDQRHPRRGAPPPAPRERQAEQRPTRSVREAAPEPPAPLRPAEGAAEAPAPAGIRGRFGDPGLASRLTQLEMNFRRLLACAPSPLKEADKAPAGPGVWVLTDADLSTYYYVEACQTLRVAIPHLLRSGSARRGEPIKPQLAEHLGIPESRVAKYLNDHCVVRWLQMDEDASYFAHFLIAVLRPALNQ